MKTRTMKPLFLSMAAAAFPVVAQAATVIVVQDTFTDGGASNGTDALDVSWSGTGLMVDNTAPLPGTGNYLQVTPTDVFQSTVGTLPTNSLLNLQVGQTLVMSFNILYNTAPGNGDGYLRFGILATGGTTSGLGIGAVVATGTNTQLQLRHDDLSDTTYFGGSAANSVTYAGGVNMAMAEGLQLDSTYAVLLSITRNASSLDLETTANGGSSTASVADGALGFVTDFSQGRVVIRAGNTSAAYRVDDFQITVVPEPNALGMACLGALGLLRRKRA